MRDRVETKGKNISRVPSSVTESRKSATSPIPLWFLRVNASQFWGPAGRAAFLPRFLPSPSSAASSLRALSRSSKVPNLVYMTRGAANERRSWRFCGGREGWAPRLWCLPCSVNGESERRPVRPTAPCPSRCHCRVPEPGPLPDLPRRCVPLRSPRGPDRGPRPGPLASGARGRSVPGHFKRCAAGQQWPHRWSCCRRRRPARPAPPAPRAPERRARSSSTPTPPPAPQADRAPLRLRGLHASCPAEATFFGRGPLHTMAPGRTGAGATMRARLALALALASVLSWPPASACPTKCTCSAASVDCHGLGLRAVPRGIPRNTERL